MSRYNADYVLIGYHLIVILLTVLERSGFIPLQFSVSKVGTDCKNCDEFMNFIVRVSTSAVIHHHAGSVLRAQSPFLLTGSSLILWAG